MFCAHCGDSAEELGVKGYLDNVADLGILLLALSLTEADLAGGILNYLKYLLSYRNKETALNGIDLNDIIFTAVDIALYCDGNSVLYLLYHIRNGNTLFLFQQRKSFKKLAVSHYSSPLL
jgi:hypothetical protein